MCTVFLRTGGGVCEGEGIGLGVGGWFREGRLNEVITSVLVAKMGEGEGGVGVRRGGGIVREGWEFVFFVLRLSGQVRRIELVVFLGGVDGPL